MHFAVADSAMYGYGDDVPEYRAQNWSNHSLIHEKWSVLHSFVDHPGTGQRIERNTGSTAVSVSYFGVADHGVLRVVLSKSIKTRNARKQPKINETHETKVKNDSNYSFYVSKMTCEMN